MNRLGEKSLKTLEYYEILDRLAAQAASEAAKEKCRALRPLDDHEQVQVWMAHQRLSLADQEKVTLEEFISTPWQSEDAPFWTALDIRELRFTNFFDFYTDWVDRLSVQNAQEKLQVSEDLTGEEARQLLAQREQLEKEIAALRAELKKETQFSRKVELNMRIKKLEGILK